MNYGEIVTEELYKMYKSFPKDKYITMAIAISLGYKVLGENQSLVKDLLIELIDSEWQRTRYRAASSIERIASRSDTNKEIIKDFYNKIKNSLKKEHANSVKKQFKKVESTLEFLKD